MWTAPPSTPIDGPLVGDDRPMLEAYLAFQRATFLNVCAGLTADQLAARPLPSSELSLLGLVRHLAKVDRIWLRIRVAGEDVAHLHGGPGAPDDFADADPARAAEEVAALQEEWRRADAAVAAVPFTHEFDHHGRPMSLRMTYVHLIGEYARHNGHADLLREAVDGVTDR
jgi:uncharacterized damage-inducible protein DinB